MPPSASVELISQTTLRRIFSPDSLRTSSNTTSPV